jgi:hypothetical protein
VNGRKEEVKTCVSLVERRSIIYPLACLIYVFAYFIFAPFTHLAVIFVYINDASMNTAIRRYGVTRHHICRCEHVTTDYYYYD